MASYRRAVQWVADNDSAGEGDALDVAAVSQLITTALVADIFGKDDMTVGADVVRARKQQNRRVKILFAHRTFAWTSDARGKAQEKGKKVK